MTQTKPLLLTLALAALIACGGGDGERQATREAAAQQAGDVRVVLLTAEEGLELGQRPFAVEFRSAAGELVDMGQVDISSTMSMPGMSPMVAPIEMKPASAPGRYEGSGNFTMSGAWQFEVRWNGPRGQGSANISASVH